MLRKLKTVLFRKASGEPAAVSQFLTGHGLPTWTISSLCLASPGCDVENRAELCSRRQAVLRVECVGVLEGGPSPCKGLLLVLMTSANPGTSQNVVLISINSLQQSLNTCRLYFSSVGGRQTCQTSTLTCRRTTKWNFHASPLMVKTIPMCMTLGGVGGDQNRARMFRFYSSGGNQTRLQMTC